MPYKDPKKQKEAQRLWYQNVVKKRREDWFAANGPCRECNLWSELELDHIDPSKKVHHAIWSWSDKRRSVELAKCQILCYECHIKKTVKFLREIDVWKETRIVGPEGMAWCTGHKDFHLIEEFGSRADKWNGLREYCKRFRNEALKLGLQM